MTKQPDGSWLIVRPCCGATGVLRAPANAVLITHADDCPAQPRLLAQEE